MALIDFNQSSAAELYRSVAVSFAVSNIFFPRRAAEETSHREKSCVASPPRNTSSKTKIGRSSGYLLSLTPRATLVSLFEFFRRRRRLLSLLFFVPFIFFLFLPLPPPPTPRPKDLSRARTRGYSDLSGLINFTRENPFYLTFDGS